MSDEPYSTIRDFLGPLIGKTLVDVTQHEQEEWVADRTSYVCLMFSDGSTVRFPTGDRAFIMEGPIAADPDEPDEIEVA